MNILEYFLIKNTNSERQFINNSKLAFMVLLIVSSTVSAVFSNPQNQLRKWRGQLPNKIGCKNGTLTWNQISSTLMVNQDELWSDFQTTAKVHLILTRPGYKVIEEEGTAINHGVNASVSGKRISAGIGTQSISLSLDKKVICESWKFGKQTSGFFSSN